MDKWFTGSTRPHSGHRINYDYLSAFGTANVAMELTMTSPPSFQRAEAPLEIFLQSCQLSKENAHEASPRFYIAQTPLSRLPSALQHDLPTPELVTKTGLGDVYDANIWMGLPPTYTPLHRDPNHNLFVQLAGQKVARLLPPEEGDRIFSQVQAELKRSASKSIRGNEMMIGEEREALERMIWTDPTAQASNGIEVSGGLEATVDDGDALYIPQGWWHSIKGVGSGISASANWWFR